MVSLSHTWVSGFKFRRVVSVDSTFRPNKPKRRSQLFFALRVVPPAQYPEKPFKPNIKTQREIRTQRLSLSALPAIVPLCGTQASFRFSGIPEFGNRNSEAGGREMPDFCLLAPECQNGESGMSRTERALKKAINLLEGKNIVGAMLNKVRADEIPLALRQR